MAHNETKVRNLLMIGIGLICLSVSLHSGFSSGDSSLEHEGQDDLSSLANSSIKRDTEFGKISKGASSDEMDILRKISEFDISSKWDLNMISAADAWKRHRALGSRDIKVCVIDTGIDTKHPALKNNLWINPGESCPGKNGERILCEKSFNGIDDDGNGFADDVYGWNFVANNNDLSDNHGHGTHISGIIGAEGGKGTRMMGIAPRVSIITAKYYDPKSPSSNNLINTIRAIRYCTQVGATIINYSGGGLEPSEKEKEAIRDARDASGRPILFIAASGNERSNSDYKKYYPADYDLPNIISVTAIDRDKNVLESSNYGEQSVDIAAPGKDIRSTLPGSTYGTMTGTSQATAVVTGAAALVKAKFPDYTATEVIKVLTETGDFDPDKLRGKTSRQKRLNVYRALSIIGEGTNVTGIVPKNTGHFKPRDFSIGANDEYTPMDMSSDADNNLSALIKNAREAAAKAR